MHIYTRRTRHCGQIMGNAANVALIEAAQQGAIDQYLSRELQEEAIKAKRQEEIEAADFYFIRSAHIVSLYERGQQTLPRFQDLIPQGVLERCRIDIPSAIRGHYRKNYLCVSHRWTQRSEPDADGKQMSKLVEFLRRNPQIEMVWVDYCCLPQGDRTAEEKKYFEEALYNVNVLYSTMWVLILYDRDYNRRFWCLLETILALRNPSAEGLSPSQGSTHHDIVAMNRTTPRVLEAFVDEWMTKSYVDCLQELNSDDVEVTNQKDKKKVQKNLVSFGTRVQQLFDRNRRSQSRGTSGAPDTARHSRARHGAAIVQGDPRRQQGPFGGPQQGGVPGMQQGIPGVHPFFGGVPGQPGAFGGPGGPQQPPGCPQQ